MSETVELTSDLIEAAKSEQGGWTREQLECIGIGWPPPKEWKRQVIGRKIDKASAERFLKLKKASPDQLNLF